MTPSLLFVSAALLSSLIIYVLSGGADYGRGVWDLLANGPRAEQQQRLIEDSIGPIWEADHVWLILVVVILFTGFPPAFAMITTTLHIPLTIMLIGIVLRGSAFSFRSYGVVRSAAQRRWGRVFAIASLITPIMLGIAIGAIASSRIRENPRQLSDFVLPWLEPFPFAVGLFALFLFAYLAATYLAATHLIDRAYDSELREDFRRRAIGSAFAAGLMAGVVLLLSIHGASPIWRGLTQRPWTWPLVWTVTFLGIGALYSLWTRRFVTARTCAQGQVAFILLGWALAQFPNLVEPNITIYNAASPPITLHLLAGALAAGALVLFPSFRYLLIVFGVHPRHAR